MSRRRRKNRREVAGNVAGEVGGTVAESAVWLVLDRSARLVARGLRRLLDTV